MCQTGVFNWQRPILRLQENEFLKELLVNQTFETDMILSYIPTLIPILIPWVGLFAIPIAICCVSRCKCSLNKSRNLLLSFSLIALTALLALLSYELFVYVDTCEANKSFDRFFNISDDILSSITSSNCDIDVSFDMTSLKESVKDVIDMINKYIQEYYMILFIIFPLISSLLLLGVGRVFKRLGCPFYSCFIFSTLISWLFGCMILLVSYMLFEIDATIGYIAQQPSLIIPDTVCNYSIGPLSLTPCAVLSNCYQNESLEIFPLLFNDTDADASIASSLTDSVFSLLQNDINITREDASEVFDLLLNETTINVFDALSSNSTIDSEDLTQVLENVKSTLDIFVNDTYINATTEWIDSIQSNIANTTNVTNNELSNLVNNVTIPTALTNVSSQEIFPVFSDLGDIFTSLSGRRALQETLPFGDLESFTCPLVLFDDLTKNKYSCDILTDSINSLHLTEIANVLFLISLLTLLIISLVVVIFPLFVPRRVKKMKQRIKL
jgi:hypothetical protein